MFISSIERRRWFRRALAGALMFAIFLMTVVAAVRHATPLSGLSVCEPMSISGGWYIKDEERQVPIPTLPATMAWGEDTLVITHDLDRLDRGPDDVLVVPTRYQSLRVFADDRVIYEAAQGADHALSSMWHFIPVRDLGHAGDVSIEFRRYDDDTSWSIPDILLDDPGVIAVHMLIEHAMTLVSWTACMFFTVLLVLVILLMKLNRVPGIPVVSSLASFIFLSGTWIFLDSKIITLLGGNYALVYFASYAVFYIMPLPLIRFYRLMTNDRSALLRCLSWVAVGNAFLWMALDVLGLVAIRSTAISVHAIIIVFLVEFARQSLRRDRKRGSRTSFMFIGMIAIFASAVLSICFYHVGLLPPANSAIIYAWSVLAIAVAMMMDAIVIIGGAWEEKRSIEIYRKLATEDHMTGLSNRNAYEIRLRELAAHPTKKVCFVALDIDCMKQINDGYGHHVGDLALSFVADCIKAVFGEIGACYRIGGDEFCVIMDTDEGVDELLAEFDELLVKRNHYFFDIDVSHGWDCRSFSASAPSEEEIVELKKAADERLYETKRSRRAERGCDGNV